MCGRRRGRSWTVEGRDRRLFKRHSLTGQRIRELIASLGFDGGKTIVHDYLRDVRPLFRRREPVSA
jgi:hypothetical protein